MVSHISCKGPGPVEDSTNPQFIHISMKSTVRGGGLDNMKNAVPLAQYAVRRVYTRNEPLAQQFECKNRECISAKH